jgi:hypothetical protein
MSTTAGPRMTEARRLGQAGKRALPPRSSRSGRGHDQGRHREGDRAIRSDERAKLALGLLAQKGGLRLVDEAAEGPDAGMLRLDELGDGGEAHLAFVSRHRGIPKGGRGEGAEPLGVCAIARAARSSHLETAYGRLLTEGERVPYLCFSGDDPERLARHLASTDAEHRAFFRAVADRDPEAAERIAGSHVELFRSRLLVTLNRDARPPAA